MNALLLACKDARVPAPVAVKVRPRFLCCCLLFAWMPWGVCESEGPVSAERQVRVESGPPDESRTSAEAWTLGAVLPGNDDGIRILIVHDMEGLSGQDDPRTYNFGTEQYASGQELLAADGLVGLVSLARVGYRSLLQEVVAARPDGSEIFSESGAALRQRWYDQESGNYERPLPDAPMGESIRGLHGYR